MPAAYGCMATQTGHPDNIAEGPEGGHRNSTAWLQLPASRHSQGHEAGNKTFGHGEGRRNYFAAATKALRGWLID